MMVGTLLQKANVLAQKKIMRSMRSLVNVFQRRTQSFVNGMSTRLAMSVNLVTHNVSVVPDHKLINV